MARNYKRLGLVATVACALAFVAGVGSAKSGETEPLQKPERCSGKGEVIVLQDSQSYQIHAVYDYEAGTVSTIKVYKDGSLIVKQRQERIR
jgi:hypothetical protein